MEVPEVPSTPWGQRGPELGGWEDGGWVDGMCGLEARWQECGWVDGQVNGWTDGCVDQVMDQWMVDG